MITGLLILLLPILGFVVYYPEIVFVKYYDTCISWTIPLHHNDQILTMINCGRFVPCLINLQKGHWNFIHPIDNYPLMKA